jgi:hypothetical protein
MLIPVLQINKNYAEAEAVSDSLLESYVRGGKFDKSLWVKLIEAAKHATDRTCGTCNMCCYALSIDEPLNKPAGDMCKNCAPGVGCKIYADRPPVCSDYYCAWLADDFFGPEWFPAESKILIQRSTGDEKFASYRFIVDEGYKDRWREEPYFSTIRQVADIGLNKKHFATTVYAGNEAFVVLPHIAVNVTGHAFIPIRVGPGRYDWDVTLFKDEADGIKSFLASTMQNKKAA